LENQKKFLKLVRNNGWPVTFSIGVATFIRPLGRIDEMIDAADAQMYFAKQNGKIRIRHKVIADLEFLQYRFRNSSKLKGFKAVPD
jgi:GGDEF domain-containing protein